MTTFLFTAGNRSLPSEALLARSLRITQQVMPSFGVELAASTTILPEMTGGWWYVVPKHEQNNARALITEYVTPQLAVLVYGSLVSDRRQLAATTIAEAWLSGGMDSVRNLNGDFGAVIVDRQKHRVFCVSDFVGRRYLRYCTPQESLLVSPHDVCLAATGLMPAAAIDSDAAAGILVYTNSIHCQSLFQGLATVDPLGTLSWESGKAVWQRHRVLTADNRIAERDHRAIAEHLDRIIEAMREETRALVEPEAVIRLDLTAGMDTRAVLGLLLSVFPKERLQASVVGDSEALDVVAGRFISQRLGLNFKNQPLQAIPSNESFLHHADLRAFFTNGDTSSKRSLAAVPEYPLTQRPHFNGRGNSTCHSWINDPQDQWLMPAVITQQTAFQKFQQRYYKDASRFPWIDAAIETRLRERLDAITAPYEHISTNGHDLLYLTYIYSREMLWCGMPFRLPWLRDDMGPLQSTQLIRDVFNKLPPPISRTCLLHARLVRRYLPFTYWMRINGKTRLSLEHRPGFWRLLDRVDERLNRGNVRRMAKNSATSQFRTVERMRDEAYRGPLKTLLKELFSASGSIALALFGKPGIDELFKRCDERKINTSEHMGLLVTMERYRLLVQQTYQLASRENKP